MKIMHGINPIAAMPFTESGHIDIDSFINMLEHLAKTGVNGLTLFGIASEFAKLTESEKNRLAEKFIQTLANSPLYRVISVTDHCTEIAVERAKYYQQLGADALMLLPPFFLQPSMDAVIQHVCCVLDAVSIPVMVQYAPNETSFPILPKTLTHMLQKYPHALFKIESTPPIEYTKELITLAPQATIFNGYAGLYMLDMLNIGAKGVMPGCSFSEIYVNIYQFWRNGEREKAQSLHQQLLPYIQRWMTHCEYIIQVEKSILKRRKIIQSDYCRHPGWPLSVEDFSIIDHFIDEFTLS